MISEIHRIALKIESFMLAWMFALKWRIFTNFSFSTSTNTFKQQTHWFIQCFQNFLSVLDTLTLISLVAFSSDAHYVIAHLLLKHSLNTDHKSVFSFIKYPHFCRFLAMFTFKFWHYNENNGKQSLWICTCDCGEKLEGANEWSLVPKGKWNT